MSGMAAIIACALLVGLAALLVLLWAIGSGQYEDLEGAAHRVLLDDPDDHCSGSEEPES
jgi:cbb3-type cytochrome oxidase maturation protein